MSTRYPARIDDSITLPISSDNSTLVRASVLNEIREALIAIETTLGVNPASIYGTIRERLNTIDTIINNLEIGGGNFIANGDLSGTSLSQTVIGIQGYSVSNDVPTDGYLLTWSALNNQWEPAANLPESQLPIEIFFASGLFTTTSSTFTRAGARKFDISSYPATIGSLSRTVKFIADVDKTSGATNIEIQLYDNTNSVIVTGTGLTSTSDSNIEVTSAALTVGSSAGNIRSDVASQYELQIKMNGGGGSDSVSITNARLEISYA